MRRTRVKILAAGVACLLGGTLLWLTAGPAAGDPPRQFPFNPGINVSDLRITRADTRLAEGWFTITNTSGGHDVQIEQFAMAWQWIGQGGVRGNCQVVRFRWTIGGTVVAPGTVIPGNTTVRVDYIVACDHDPSFLAREIRNFVAIKLVGRSKFFGSSGSFRLL